MDNAGADNYGQQCFGTVHIGSVNFGVMPSPGQLTALTDEEVSRELKVVRAVYERSNKLRQVPAGVVSALCLLLFYFDAMALKASSEIPAWMHILAIFGLCIGVWIGLPPNIKEMRTRHRDVCIAIKPHVQALELEGQIRNARRRLDCL